MPMTDLQKSFARLDETREWMTYYITYYGPQTAAAILAAAAIGYFLANNRWLLRWRARRGDPVALARLTKRYVTTAEKHLMLVALETVARARMGSVQDMEAIIIRMQQRGDPYFLHDPEISELWKRRLKTFIGEPQPEPGAATQIHEVDQGPDPYLELNALIGLDDVKQAMTEIANRAELFEKRKRAGLPVTHPALHLIFLGNPGTGKTTVARILGRLLHKIGYLSRGHVIEVSEGELIGRYVGETPIKVHKKIQMAMGGILFIDEAYSMLNADGDRGSFSSSAIATLVKYMEDFRHDLVIIAAGYPAEMIRFMDSNPGLRSRFTEVITFEDYTAEDMVRIFRHMAAVNHYVLATDALASLLAVMGELKMASPKNFANGRAVRNLFEDSITFMASRIAKVKEPSKETLMRIARDDVMHALEKMKAARAASMERPKEPAQQVKDG